MVRCDRCEAYVSRDYARVFGDNQDAVTSCPNCRAGWDEGSESTDQGSERKLSFRMSEFDSEEHAVETDDASPAGDPSASEGEDDGPFGRVGRAVSGLF
ncbi:DUF7563 family protein [Halalkalicoccus tibetensis]|uniref:Small CPxCG-related zinc finger protein n=1 Tax=Halalkalicoccus tibetensis TaxID=175632 RepID=A0ABD5V791_9EURY